MSRQAEQKLAASKKRLIEKVNESYVNGEKQCNQDQLRKTDNLYKELAMIINTFQKDRKQVETSAVRDFEEEQKYLLEFEGLQNIIDTA